VKVRRRIEATGQPERTVLQVERAGSWEDLPRFRPGDPLAWLEGLAPEVDQGAPAALPFAPRSFRDCALFERHWAQSSRGYARRFLPLGYRASRVYETLTGSTFPAFRLHALSRTQPLYYFGNHLTFVPSGTPIQAPAYTRALDYELELGFVLARPLLDATPDEAIAAVGGFVVVNDWSARDVQRPEMQSGLGPQKSKHFFSSMSETLLTADEVLGRVTRLPAVVEMNGRIVARTSTEEMRPGLGEVLAHLSKGERLLPGELIATGTLPDGSGMENGHWPKPGDVLRLVVEPVGEIVHRIL
jgi:2-keto-4-pentenoate hydratase/2-oxohepta-3-ene-1,7-dioic acid hydratase in catechol pathway